MKKMKSTVALVLALIMAFSAFTCASAAPASASDDASIAKAVDTLADAAEESGTHANCHNGDCGHAPVVVVPGINHSPTYLYDENDEPVLNKDGKRIGGTLLILDTDNLVTVILKSSRGLL